MGGRNQRRQPAEPRVSRTPQRSAWLHLPRRLRPPAALLVLGLLAGLPSAPARAARTVALQPELRRLALLVAHPEGGPDTERLRYAEQDARKLGEVLVELGGFRPADVTLLLVPDADGLRQALAAAERQVDAALARGQRVLQLVYYSGHGAGGALRLGEQRFSLVELRRSLQPRPGTIRIALLDACQSGAITRLKGGRRSRTSLAVDLLPAPGSTGSVIITSSSESEASQESDELRGSFFTHYLVSGLRGAADRSADGLITLVEAYDHAYHQTVARTAGTWGGTQHPTYTYDLQGQGSIVLTRLQGQGALLFPSGLAGELLVYDLQRDRVVGEVHKAAGQLRQLRVPAGSYVIKQRRRDHLLLQQVQVAAGRPVEVRPEAFERAAFEDDLTKGPAFLQRAQLRRRGLVLSGGAGLQSFFDEPSRTSLFPSTTTFGLQLELSNLLAPRLSLHLDAAYGRTEAVLQAGPYAGGHPVEFQMLVAGAWLSRSFSYGPWLLRAGPRLSSVYARRDFGGSSADLPYQDLLTFSPGLEANLGVRLSCLRLGAGGRIHYLHYSTTTEDRSLGFGELYMTLGYAFGAGALP